MLNPNFDKLSDKSIRRRELLAERDGFMGCAYCGVASAPNFLVLEHVIPRSRRGPDGNYNRVLACHDCDVEKGGRTPQEWKPGVIFGNSVIDNPTHLRRYEPVVVKTTFSPFGDIKFCGTCGNVVYASSPEHCTDL